MYVPKKMLAKREKERLADQANVNQQLDDLKNFASMQQINSAQQQQQQTLTAFLAAMMNKNYILNQQPPPSTPVAHIAKANQSKSTNQTSRKRSHSDLDAFSSSEEEPYCYAKMRQPPSLGKINSPKKSNQKGTKLDQNNNANISFQETSVSNNLDAKQYDSNHSDEEESDGKKQNKDGRNYRKMLIEKRRRDRINNSLNELRRLVPAAYEKQGSAKLEKAEILQMTVDHLKLIHAKGFDFFAFEPSKLGYDYHRVGYNECAREVEQFLATNENEQVKQRVISHLRGHSNESKDGNNNDEKSMFDFNSDKHANGKARNSTGSSENSPTNKKINNQSQSKVEIVEIKSEHKDDHQKSPINSQQVNNNLLNLHHPIPSPPSSVSPSSLSTSSQSSNTVTSSTCSESDNSQVYFPYNYLKNKLLSYSQANSSSPSIHNMTNFKPNQDTLQNFTLKSH